MRLAACTQLLAIVTPMSVGRVTWHKCRHTVTNCLLYVEARVHISAIVSQCDAVVVEGEHPDLLWLHDERFRCLHMCVGGRSWWTSYRYLPVAAFFILPECFSNCVYCTEFTALLVPLNYN